jgi:hypothetical protein
MAVKQSERKSQAICRLLLRISSCLYCMLFCKLPPCTNNRRQQQGFHQGYDGHVLHL